MRKFKIALAVIIVNLSVWSCDSLLTTRNPRTTDPKSSTPKPNQQGTGTGNSSSKSPSALIESIDVPASGLILNIGETKSLKATAKTVNGQSAGNLKWESSDPGIVFITENGSATGISIGSSTLKVFSQSEPDKSYTIPVIVDDIGKSINRVDIKPNNIIISNKGTASASVAITKTDNTQDNRVMWVIQNTTLAEVDDEGKVKAKLEGDTKLEAISLADNSYKSSIKVIIRDNVESFVNDIPLVESISLTEKFLMLNLGESKIINATVNYNLGRKDKNFTVRSNDQDTVSVEDNKIIALKEGKTIIKIYSGIEPDNSFYLPVIVRKLPVIISTVSANPTFQALKEGESIKVDSSAFRNDKSESKALKFNNLTTDILQLDNDTVKAIKEGEGKFEVISTEDDSKKTIVNISVSKNDNKGPSKISLDEPTVSAKTDNFFNATLKWLTISSANKYQVYRNKTLVATVESNSWTDTSLKEPSYDYYITACLDKLCSTASNTVKVLSPPPLPTILEEPVINGTNLSYNLTLRWKEIAGATSYQIFRNKSSIGTTKNTSYFAPNLSEDFSDYYILACNTGGCSNASNIITVYEPLPPAPIIDDPVIKRSANLSSVSLKWSPVNGANYYKIYNGGKLVYLGSSTTFKQNKLEDSYYEYFVSACNNSGCSPLQSTSSLNTIEKLPAPVIKKPLVSGIINSKYSIFIEWSKVEDIDNFRFYRLYKNGILIYEGNNLNFDDTNQTDFEHYYYVESCNSIACNKSETVKSKK